MKKRLLSLLLALAMCLSLGVPAWATSASSISEEEYAFLSQNSTYIPSEKIGEDLEYVYFFAEVPQTTIFVSTADYITAAEPVPVSVGLETTVSKSRGEVTVKIIIICALNIKSATCSFITVRGAMGLDSRSNVSATNIIAFPAIVINETFSGLEKNVDTGTVYISTGVGSFSGANGLIGGFSGATTSFDLESL